MKTNISKNNMQNNTYKTNLPHEKERRKGKRDGPFTAEPVLTLAERTERQLWREEGRNEVMTITNGLVNQGFP